ncbi:hypothetical protein DXG03_004771, partial [Asterophora parasitica]
MLHKTQSGLLSLDFSNANSSGTSLGEPSVILEDISALSLMQFNRFLPRRRRAPPSAAIFVSIIIKLPIVQIITIVLGIFIVALEFPVPPLKALAIHRSIVLRIVLLLLQALLTVLFYQ